MALFQASVLKKGLSKQDKAITGKAYKKFKKFFLEPKIQENIRNSKEEEFQEGFLRELFVNILGYIIKPNDNHNLTTEFKNLTGAKKADGAILIKGKALAVIELKSTKVKDLENIRQQAFDYKSHHPTCKYVITSTFDRLRFYIENSVDFEEFDLFNLTEQQFELLYFCLAKDNLLNNIPLQTKEASVIQEEKVTKQLYADYSLFKREIYRDIVKQNFKNPQLRELTDKHIKKTLFKKTQKLLDRFLFVFFAEDRNLLPPNSISQIIDKWQDDVAFGEDKKLYDIYKSYFHVLDVGRPKQGNRQEIFAYNGGLFKPDAILDSLIIDNDLLLKHTVVLTKYDFETDVDVNILGHIFENSLNEIESINAEIEGVEFDKQKTKRKKDGVFYTPKYITKYIVDNTVGKLCDEKKKELDITDEVYLNAKQRSKKRIDNLDDYRKWLLQLTICDPACGSGAFLNQALDFLIKEHRYIDQLTAKYHNVPLVLSEVENSILENNIYGVDLNEESVEIAKLSLWLRTAQKGRKLTSLSSNIKCGNSLIDNKAVAGDKAFNWQEEFSDVFANGGFDVVIGNPPYVRVQQLDYEIIDNLKTNYKTALKRIDISLCFIELSSRLIKLNYGLTSFITSNQFLTTEYGQAMRAFILNEYNLIECVDFGDLPVFENALTYVSIFTFKKSIVKDFKYFHVANILNASSNNYGVAQKIENNQLTNDNWNLKSFGLKDIYTKLNKEAIVLGEIGNAWAGLFTGKDDILMFSSDDLININIEKEILLPVIRANNCSKYYCSVSQKFVIYPYKYENGKTIVLTENELQERFPKAYSYLLLHKTELGKRKDSRKTFAERKDWYTLARFGQKNIFDKIKIVSPGEVKDHKFCIDYSKSGFSCARVFAITIENDFFDIKYLLCILNSNLMKSFLQSFSSLKNGGFYSYSSNILNKVPVKNISQNNQLEFIEFSNSILELNSKLNQFLNKFKNYIQSQYKIEKLSKKLQNWHELEFADFIKELNKAIKKAGGEKLSKTDEFEWLELFENKKAEAQKLKSEIEKTDKEIDQMVYELYGLTDEEIKIVEGVV